MIDFRGPSEERLLIAPMIRPANAWEEATRATVIKYVLIEVRTDCDGRSIN